MSMGLTLPDLNALRERQRWNNKLTPSFPMCGCGDTSVRWETQRNVDSINITNR